MFSLLVSQHHLRCTSRAVQLHTATITHTHHYSNTGTQHALPALRHHTNTLNLRHSHSYSTTTCRHTSTTTNHHRYTFKLPSLSPSFKGGVVTKWYVEEGQDLGINDLICDITTSTLTEDSSLKQVVQLESQEEGQVTKQLVPIGGEVQLGEPLLELECEDDMRDRSFAWQAYTKKSK